MIKVTKKKLFWVVELICFVVFVLLCMGLFYLVGNRNDDTSEKIDDSNKKISLNYVINLHLGMDVPIKLEEKEEHELYDLVKKLEFVSSDAECFIDTDYYLEYDDNKLYLDKECDLVFLNEEEYAIDKGAEELFLFLEKKTEKLNNVYLFNYDQEKQSSTMIELSDEDKNEIRELWKLNEKNGVILNLELIVNYVLVVDDDIITIQELGDFVNYSGEYIRLSNDLYNKLASFMNIDILSFKTEDYNREIAEFGPLFNKYKGEEINSRDDALNNAKMLWKEHLKYDVDNSLFELQYQVSYDALNDNYLVYAYPIEENVLDGCFTIIMKRTGEVVALWGR